MRLSIVAVLFFFSSLVIAQEDALKKPIVVPVPGVDSISVKRDIRYSDEDDRLLADIFTPTDTTKKYPAVIFVHGGPVPDSLPIAAKDWGQYQSYGALMAANELAGVVFNFRHSSYADSQNARTDILSLIDFIQDNADEYAIDKNNVCIWFFSGGGSYIAPVMERRSESVKCISIYYGVVGPRALSKLGVELPDNLKTGLDPFPILENKTDWNPAIFVAEAGTDNPELNASLRNFAQTGMTNGWKVEYWNHPTGPHAFDILQDNERSRNIINRTVQFLKQHLK